jgi:hypothetical protein
MIDVENRSEFVGLPLPFKNLRALVEFCDITERMIWTLDIEDKQLTVTPARFAEVLEESIIKYFGILDDNQKLLMVPMNIMKRVN